MRKREWTPDRADRESLAEHLLYEVQMTFLLAGKLAAPGNSHVDMSLRDAEIESFALHLRQLIDFFWNERRRERDDRAAFAADFFVPGEWGRLRPARPPILDKPIRSGITRLSYGHDWIHPSEKVWDAISQAYALAPVVKRFADTVAHSEVPAGHPHNMRLCAEMLESAQTRAA